MTKREIYSMQAKYFMKTLDLWANNYDQVYSHLGKNPYREQIIRLQARIDALDYVFYLNQVDITEQVDQWIENNAVDFDTRKWEDNTKRLFDLQFSNVLT